MDPTHPNTERSSPPAWLIMLIVAGSAVAYYWSQSDHVTATVLAVLGIAGLSGYRVGAAKGVASLGGIVAAVFFAPVMARTFEPTCGHLFGTTGLSNRVLSIGIVGAIFALSVFLTFYLVAATLMKERPLLQRLDKWSGCLLAAAQSAVIVLVFLGGLLIVEPLAKNCLNSDVSSNRSVVGRAVAKRVLEVTRKTRHSSVGPWVVAWNPFERVPALKRLHKRIVVLSEPRSSDDSAMDDSSTNGTFQRIVEELADDPEIRKQVLSSGRLDLKTARSLLDNPTIRALLADEK